MLNFEDYDPAAGQTGESRHTDNQTDRVNGEYHHKNGYTQKIYSDAHYIHEDESTVPPRYYTPPKKQPKECKEPKERGQGYGAVKLALLCIACALAGGVVGAGIVSSQISERVNELQNYVSEIHEELLSAEERYAEACEANANSGEYSPADIYSEACKQVVCINTEVTYTSFFGREVSSTDSGSGFIATEDGYIVTNYHVIEAAWKSNSPVKVGLVDGRDFEASVVGGDESSDIAVLKIDANGLCPARIGDSDKILVGDAIFAVGNPLSWLEFSMTAGNISALDREIKTDDRLAPITMFQFDAPVNSGNSGGPLYNVRGEVIGIVTAKYSDTGVEGIGFAIPISDAYSKVNDIITKGYVTGRADISLSIDTRYTSMYSQYYRMPLGAYVASVDEGGCAQKAGIQPGDIITKVGDYSISGYDDLVSALKHFSAGAQTKLEVYRSGSSMELDIRFDEAR